MRTYSHSIPHPAIRLKKGEKRKDREDNMAFEGKKIVVYIRKSLVFLIRTSYRSACDHPFVLGMVFFLLILYRYFPALFAFLGSSSPVIICTALLLGTLLVYGEPNIPEIEEEDKKIQDISSLKVEGKGKASAANMTVRDVPFTTVRDVGVEKGEALSAGSSLVEEDKKEIHGEKKVNKARELHDQGKTEGAVKLGEEGGLKVKTDKPTLDNHFDSSLGSPWQPVDGHDASSGSESDRAESSSPDASVADVIPMLDELHPLLDSEAPQPAHRSIDNSDAPSSVTSQDHESDDDSVEEEAENQEDEDEEAQEEKDDANEAVVTWTVDDQKNLMDLGTSELERNQRLENLIAKRRARKFLSFHAEKNLIDLDGIDPVLNMEELSRFHYQIPSVSAPKRNPFDLPYDSEENMGLPPIPGSAPSVLQPRQNPFDLPYDQVEESGSLTREIMNHQEFVSAPQRDMFYRRHESFALGGSFSGVFKQETHDSGGDRLCFVAERMNLEGTGFAAFQGQSSEKSDSKVSSAHESDTNSSVLDHEDQKELVEQEVHQESHLLSPVNPYAEPVERGSQSLEEVDSVDVKHEQIGIDVDDDHAIDLNTSTVIEESDRASDAFGAVEMEIRQGEFNSPHSDDGKLEVTEERYDDLSSSSSSEAQDQSSKMSIHGESANLEQTMDDSLKDPSDSMQSVHTDSDLQSSATETVHDSQVADPVYDSSPPVVEKSLSNISTRDEALFYAGNEGFSSSNLLASDVQPDSSEVGSPPRPLEKEISSEERSFVSLNGRTGGDLSSATGGFWVASSNLSFVDEIESRSREISEIKEQDVIQAGLSGIHEDFDRPIAPIMPKFMHPSRLSSVDTDSSEDSSVEGDVMINTAASFNSSVSEKLQPLEISAIQQSYRAGLQESQISALDLSPNIEENSEDFKAEEEHESITGPTATSGLSGLQLTEENDAGFSDIEQELSSFQKKSTEESGKDNDVNRLLHEPECGNASEVSPTIPIHDVGFIGSHLMESKVGSAEVEAGERNLQPGDIEVRSAEDRGLAFEKAVQSVKKSKGGEMEAKASRSSALTLQKIRKMGKFW